MKISEMITDRYKLRIPPTVYYELLADIQEMEEHKEPTAKNDLGVDCISRTSALDSINWAYNLSDAYQKINELPSVTPQELTTKNNLAVDREDAVERLNAIKQLIGYDKDSEIVKATQKSLDMAIKALEQEPRKDEVILTNKEYRELLSSEFDNGYAKGYREALEQEPRKGHWLSQREHCEMNNLIPSGLGSYFWCSECNHAVDVREWNRNHYNYCPNCGAKMSEQEE